MHTNRDTLFHHVAFWADLSGSELLQQERENNLKKKGISLFGQGLAYTVDRKTSGKKQLSIEQRTNGLNVLKFGNQWMSYIRFDLKAG